MDTIRIIVKNDIVILSLLDDFDLLLAEDLKIASDNAFQTLNFTHLVIDLANIQTINSGGIGLLASIKTKCLSQNKKMYLLNSSENIRKTLTITRMLSFFTHIQSLDDIETSQTKQ